MDLRCTPDGNNCSRFTGIDCPLVYAGDAPGEVEGIVQFNCQIVSAGGFNTIDALNYILAPLSYSPGVPESPVYIQQ